MTKRQKFVVDQLKRAHKGEAWHGDSLTQILKGISATQAAAKPFHGAHSIWELVNHIEAWNRLIEKRIRTRTLEKMSARLDWPPLPKAKTASAWKQSLAKMHRSIHSLYVYAGKMNDEIYDRRVTGKNYNVEFMLHGVVQHNLYHA